MYNTLKKARVCLTFLLVGWGIVDVTAERLGVLLPFPNRDNLVQSTGTDSTCSVAMGFGNPSFVQDECSCLPSYIGGSIRTTMNNVFWKVVVSSLNSSSFRASFVTASVTFPVISIRFVVDFLDAGEIHSNKIREGSPAGGHDGLWLR